MEKRIFSKQALKKMIIPLLLEQFLVLIVGMVDTFMISYAGEAAVSGVSLVNNFNTIFIMVFTALASGGAVIISQYLGKGDEENAGRAASQLLMFSSLIAVVIVVFVLLFRYPLMSVLFGSVEADVMTSCITYLVITALAYPALAVYNSGASVFRSMGRTKVTMIISLIANIINVIGNYIGVFVLHAGVQGVAWPTLISYVFSAVVITALCFQKNRPVRYRMNWIMQYDGAQIGRIMKIAVPNSLESAVFQIVKVALSSIVAMFGTYQIAANGVAQSIWSLSALAGTAMGPVFITVIGQCMGSGKTEQAEYYFAHLLKITIAISTIWCTLIFCLTPLLLQFTAISAEAKSLTLILVLIHNIFCGLVSPFNCLGNGLRAAGDVKYTMTVSIISTIAVRLALSYLFAVVMNLGVIGIALAMCSDWAVRSICFVARIKSGRWKNYQLV